ncbi:hypothetical protein ACVXHA_00095 [Escherichia coli]
MLESGGAGDARAEQAIWPADALPGSLRSSPRNRFTIIALTAR